MNKNLYSIKSAEHIAYEIKDIVQVYTDVMKFSDRKSLIEIDSNDVKNYSLPKLDEINELLKGAEIHVKDKSEKESFYKCIQQIEIIRSQFVQLLSGELTIDNINVEVKKLFIMIHKLVNLNE